MRGELDLPLAERIQIRRAYWTSASCRRDISSFQRRQTHIAWHCPRYR